MTILSIKDQINFLNEEETLNIFSFLLNDKIKVLAKFYPEEGDVVTHQSLIALCGDYVAETEACELDVPLCPVAIVGHLHKNQIN